MIQNLWRHALGYLPRGISCLTPFLIILIALTTPSATAHDNPGYFHGDTFSNGQAGNNPNWMAALDDDVRVNDLSVPGTHDTMAKYGGDIAECQSMTLSQQLNSGIRALDIRVKLDGDDEMTLWHGITYQHAYLDADVFAVIEAFLLANPSECVFMDVQNEAGAEVKTEAFAAEMDKLRAKYASVVWNPTSQNPTLKEIRKKIVLIPHWGMPSSLKRSIGLDTSLNGAIGQDDAPKEVDKLIQIRYSFSTNWDQYDKWLHVRTHLGHTSRSRAPGLYQNWLNGSGGSFPYFVASGHSSHFTNAPRLSTGCTTTFCGSGHNSDFPRTACADFGYFGKACTISFEGINTLTMDFINRGVVAGTNERLGRVGMIFADYPGRGLIEAIIGQNGVRRVTNTNDSGEGSLRWALANTGGISSSGDFKGGKIVFDKSLSGATIELSTMLDISKNVFIDAKDLEKGITISGANKVRVLNINKAVHVRLRGLNITRGFATGEVNDGAGIYSGAKKLEIIACTIHGNQAEGDGSAIFQSSFPGEPDGACFITNSTIANNVAKTGSIYNGKSRMTLNHCTVANNTNDSLFFGAGILNRSKTPVSLSNSIVYGNRFANGGDDLDGEFAATAPNIIGGQAAGKITGVAPINENPRLGSLRENGDELKSALTLLPDFGSPALKAGLRVSVGDDQYGRDRHKTNPTLGAVEVEANPSFQLVGSGGRILEKDSDTLGFGNIDPGKALYLLPTIVNRGNQPLNRLRENLMIDGPDAAMFEILDLPSAEIGPLVSTNLRLQFVPTSPGIKVATLHISSNDPEQESYKLTLTGVGNQSVQVERTTRGRPSWHRPGEGQPPADLALNATATPFDVVAFSVTSPAKYSITSTAPTSADWDLFLLLYSGSFESGSPMTDLETGSRGGPANVATISFHPGITYYAVTTGLSNSSEGEYTLNIAGPEKVTVIAPAADASPRGNQTSVSVQPTFSWTNTPETEYELFLGNTPDGLESLGFKTSPFTLDRILNQNSRYFWRLDSIHGNSIVSSGINSFTTGSTLRVTTSTDENDSGLGRGLGDSLREVIAVASSAGGGVTVQFASSLSGSTIALQGSPLSLNSDITIDGTALSDRITIQAPDGSRVFEMGPGTSTSLRGLRITGGNADLGGGISSRGTLLTLSDCEVSGNRASLDGGAIHHANGNLIIERSSITQNKATKGAGIFLSSGSKLEVHNSKLSANTATEGGAVYSQGAQVFIEQGALIGNGGNSGGALSLAGGTALIENSTLSGNGATGGSGGGIHSQGDAALTLRHATVVENIGAGIQNDAPAQVTLENSIVANNLDLQNQAIDLNGDFNTSQANLIRVHTGTQVSGPAPLVGDPLLGPLRNGTYFAPLIGSPAIDAAIQTADTPELDQNNQCCRPFGSAPDLGAIETKLKADATLAWLTFSGGLLSPAFQSTEYNYTANVPSALSRVAVRPAPGARGQSMAVRVNEGEFVPVPPTSFGTPKPSEDILLVPGSNTIEVQVTAQNGVSTQSYTISVIRANREAVTGELKSLAVAEESLSPAFNPGRKTYQVVVAHSRETVSITALPANDESAIAVRTNFGEFAPLIPGALSQALPLKVGVNSMDIQVLGMDGVQSSLYSIAVVRQAEADMDANLVSLTTSAGPLSPDFFASTSLYQVQLKNDVNSLTVTPTASQSDSQIELRVNGSEPIMVDSGMESSPLNLIPGKNVVEVNVTAQDGVTIRSYRIQISRVTDGLEWISKPGRGQESFVSADGLLVAFSSSAKDLVPDDTNGESDIFVLNRQTGALKRVSVSNEGVQGDADSIKPAISANGRYVAFQSEASNLVPDDRNGRTSMSAGRDIFVYDLSMNTIERVSLTETGAEANQQSRDASISEDGRYVAFASGANNLIAGFRNGDVNVYVRDRVENTIVGVAVPFSDIQTNRNSLNPVISANGQFVAFEYNVSSSSDNSNERYKSQEIYLFDRLTRGIERISGTRFGREADGDESSAPSISADGRWVAYHSNHADLDFFDTNRGLDVFVYDRIDGSTRRSSTSFDGVDEASRNSINPAISGNGQFVAFESSSSKLVDGDLNNQPDIFVKDLRKDTLTLKSVTVDGIQGDGQSTAPALSFDGQILSFQSRAKNLAPADTNNFDDVYLVYSQAFDGDPFADLTFALNFDSEQTGDTAFNGNVETGASVAALRPVAIEPGSTLEFKVDGGEFQPQQSANEPLIVPLSQLGNNSSILVKVTTPDGLSQETSFNLISMRTTTDASLNKLSLQQVDTGRNIPLTPNFDPASSINAYTAIVDERTTALSLRPTFLSLNAQDHATINGQQLNDEGTILVELSRGENTLTIDTTAEDGISTRSYVVTVIRPFSNNADLTSITTNAGTLVPPFEATTTEYSLEVEEALDSVRIIAQATETGASMTLNGEVLISGQESQQVPLHPGFNSVGILVTAPDGVTSKTYTLSILRPLLPEPIESNTNLTFLSLSAGALTPGFNAETTEYTLNVAGDVASTTVFPIAADSEATVSVNGVVLPSGIASEAIDLLAGQNQILIEVTGASGNPRVYSVTVIRDTIATEFNIVIDRIGGPIELSWTEPGLTLQQSTDLQTWQNIENAVSPYQPEIGNPSQFYRLVR